MKEGAPSSLSRFSYTGIGRLSAELIRKNNE
jgi:hypothetical protein